MVTWCPSTNHQVLYHTFFTPCIGLYHHQSVLPKGRSFTENSGTKAAVMPKGRSSTANSGTKVTVLRRMNSCGSFPLLSAPQSLVSIWTDLKRSEKIPGAPASRWGEWIWITGSFGLHQNSLHGLISVPSGFLTRSEIWKFQSPFAPYIQICK